MYQINQALCSGCHRCRVECPVGALTFKNHKYWIREDVCVSCGHCAEICHNEAISDPDATRTTEKSTPVELHCDVLVIGGGASGLVAAARAATLGKKVIVLEKNKELGGSGWYAHVFRNNWSKWHEEAGLTDPRDTLYKEFMETTGGSVNPKLLRRVLDANADFVNWLINDHDLGKDFKLGPMFWGGFGLQGTYEWEYNAKRIDTTIGPGGTGWYMTNKMRDILLAHSGEFYCHAQATRLLTDSSGAVVGAEAERPEGKMTVHAKSTVVAAGAFTHNRELMAKFQPHFYNDADEPVHTFTCPTCTGDGIVMCDELGADVDYHNARAAMFGPMRHPYGTCSLMAALYPSAVRINSKGERMDTAMYMLPESPLSFQEGRYCWHILTHRDLDAAMKSNIGKPDELPGVKMDGHYANWEAELEFEYPSGSIFKCDTLEELAEKMNVPFGAMMKSIEEYNAEIAADPAKAAAGVPGGMGAGGALRPIEKGPYYGIFMKLFHENALGGVVTDENTAVLRCGKPIPGLYATGDNTRGLMVHGELSSIYVENVVSALTYAFCSGYIAGVESAK